MITLFSPRIICCCCLYKEFLIKSKKEPSFECFFPFIDLLVAPDAIHNYVKSFKHPGKHVHFVAPEYGKYFIYAEKYLLNVQI